MPRIQPRIGATNTINSKRSLKTRDAMRDLRIAHRVDTIEITGGLKIRCCAENFHTALTPEADRQTAVGVALGGVAG